MARMEKIDCRECEQPFEVNPTDPRRVCRKCRYEMWLERNPDAVERKRKRSRDYYREKHGIPEERWRK